MLKISNFHSIFELNRLNVILKVGFLFISLCKKLLGGEPAIVSPLILSVVPLPKCFLVIRFNELPVNRLLQAFSCLSMCGQWGIAGNGHLISGP